MLLAAAIVAGLAALVHVYIFVLESVLWTSERTRKIFGTSPAQAQATRELAFNQGFYNLFLAVVAAAGVVAVTTGHEGIGAALLLAGCGPMFAAGLVLLLSSPGKAKSALVQLAFPGVGVVLTLLWLLI